MQYRGLTLDRFQADAIGALEAGRDVLVCAPTGTGKTLVADWMVERTLEAGKEVAYTAPIKALSNQKYRDYCRMLGEDRVGLVTGDLVIRHSAPCRVMTTEILRNMLLLGEELPHLQAVIIDEIHFLDDPERGTTWEELLIYLPPRVQIVGLSATLSNLEEFAAWIADVRGRPVEVVVEERRAVPLEFAVCSREGGLRAPADMERFHKSWAQKHQDAGGRRGGAAPKARPARGRRGGRSRGGDRAEVVRFGHPTRHTDVFHMLARDHLPYLYFVFSRKDTEVLAWSLGQRLQRDDGQGSLLDRDERQEVVRRLDAFATQPGADTALSQDLADLYLQGVAYHHAGLHVMLKALVEELYESRLIKVLYCTSTFALGINMPARAAVFDSMMRYDGRGMIPLPTREFMQMAGRAGRRGLDEAGLVVVRTDIDDFPGLVPQLKQYLSGRYEPVKSRFSLSFHSVVNLLLRHKPERIRSLVERSFLDFHRRRVAEEDLDHARGLAAALADQGWKDGMPVPPKLKHPVKEMRKSFDRASQAEGRTWSQFLDKVDFLVRAGYLRRPDPDSLEGITLNAGGQALRHIQIQEVFTTECFLEGCFEQVDDATLFGVLTAMCTELPRGTLGPPDRESKALARQVGQVRQGPLVMEAERVSGVQHTWDPNVIPLGRMWAEGRSLGEIMLNIESKADISGSLVGAFRRAKDLVSQLVDVYAHDPARVAALKDLGRRVTRDEVEVVD
jgi:ATP-dependent RNA helicase HelY